METIEVENCQDCPFANNDNEFGHDKCNLKDISFTKYELELPEKGVHKECPLRVKGFMISLKD